MFGLIEKSLSSYQLTSTSSYQSRCAILRLLDQFCLSNNPDIVTFNCLVLF